MCQLIFNIYMYQKSGRNQSVTGAPINSGLASLALPRLFIFIQMAEMEPRGGAYASHLSDERKKKEQKKGGGPKKVRHEAAKHCPSPSDGFRGCACQAERTKAKKRLLHLRMAADMQKIMDLFDFPRLVDA